MAIVQNPAAFRVTLLAAELESVIALIGAESVAGAAMVADAAIVDVIFSAVGIEIGRELDVAGGVGEVAGSVEMVAEVVIDVAGCVLAAGDQSASEVDEVAGIAAGAVGFLE